MRRILFLDLGQAYRELKTEYDRRYAIAATNFDENDYIRDYQEFLEY